MASAPRPSARRRIGSDSMPRSSAILTAARRTRALLSGIRGSTPGSAWVVTRILLVAARSYNVRLGSTRRESPGDAAHQTVEQEPEQDPGDGIGDPVEAEIHRRDRQDDRRYDPDHPPYAGTEPRYEQQHQYPVPDDRVDQVPRRVRDAAEPEPFRMRDRRVRCRPAGEVLDDRQAREGRRERGHHRQHRAYRPAPPRQPERENGRHPGEDAALPETAAPAREPAQRRRPRGGDPPQHRRRHPP